jgi:hemolysin D
LDTPALGTLLWHTKPGEFSPGLLEIVERPPAPIRRAVTLAMVSLLAAGLAWSWFGRLSVFCEASGRIQAVGRTKVIEPQKIGTIQTIAVHDGSRVVAGAVLAQLDPTDEVALQTQYAGQLADLQAEIVRWPVELAAFRADPVDPDTAIAWPDSTPAAARAREQAVLRADLARLAATLGDLAAQRRADEVKCAGLADAIAAQTLLLKTLSGYGGMVTELEKEGWNSHAYLLQITAQMTEADLALSRLQRDLADARAEIPVIDSRAVAAREAVTKAGEERLATLQRSAEDVTQKLAEATHGVEAMTLRAPLAGTVQASTLTSVGQVVKPGQQVMQVVPDDAPLEVAAYVPNSSIGFVRDGQPVDIKVTTFLYTNYGSVPGRITRIGHESLALMQHDSLQSASLDGEASATTVAQKTGTLVYPITVAAERSTMLIDGRIVPLEPGMAVTVDILTERRRVLDYIISPLIELFTTAIHEH